jgi:hypothetical protein
MFTLPPLRLRCSTQHVHITATQTTLFHTACSHYCHSDYVVSHSMFTLLPLRLRYCTQHVQITATQTTLFHTACSHYCHSDYGVAHSMFRWLPAGCHDVKTQEEVTVPVHATKAYRRSRGISPFILNIGTRQTRVFSITLRPLYPR